MEAEGLTVSDEEYQNEIQIFIDEYGFEDEAEIMEYYTEDEIRSDILYTKLMETLMSENNVVEGSTADTAETEAE